MRGTSSRARASGWRAAQWLAQQDPMLVGVDNWPVEVAPNPDPQISLPVHQIMLVVNGIHLLENMRLEELAAKRVHEFAFVMQPLKLQGSRARRWRRSRSAEALAVGFTASQPSRVAAV